MELSSREIQQITKEVLNTQNKIIIKMEHVKKKDSLVKDYLRN
jgi:nucleoside-triphosphatase THEP1